MEVSELLDALAAEGAVFADAIDRAEPAAAVPSCPGWTLRDLVHHIGGVHRWVTRIVGERRSEPVGDDLEVVSGGWPEDRDLASWFRAGHALLVDALRAAPGDLACWTFLRAPSPLAMWARRQAHETVIHRVDAELASGRVTPLVPALAADGIDELLTCFVPRRSTSLRTTVPRMIGVQAADTGDAWTVTTGTDAPRTERGDGDGDVVVRGDAGDLYLLVWNRRSLEGLDVKGDPSLLDQWRSDVTVRWA